MKLRPGVLLALSPSMARALPVLELVYERVCGIELVITSASDGVHGDGSRHYTGEAVDIRVHDLDTVMVLDLRRKLKDALGKSFDVVLEDDHIHVEFDPKGN